MRNYKKHIDAFIREKAGRNSETPPAHVWERLDKQLDELIPSKKPPVSFGWLRYAAMVSLVLLLGVPLIKRLSGNAASGIKNTHGEQTAATQILNTEPRTGNTGATPNSAKTGSQTLQAGAAQTNIAQNTNSNETTTGDKTGNEDKQPAITPSTGSNAVAVSTSAEQANPASKADKKNAYANNDKQHSTNTAPNIKRNKQTATIAANNNANENKGSTAAIVQPTNNYGSNYTGTNNNTVNSANNTVTPASLNNETSSTNKQTGAASITTFTKRADTAQTTPVKHVARKERKHMGKPEKRLEEGIKAGYENGFNTGAASKYVISPYIQYNVSAKVSLLAQPTVKYAQLAAKNVGNPQSYYNVNPGGQTYDSIVKSYAVHGSYMEFELPILLKYYFSKKISVFGGINLLYSRQNSIAENTYTKDGISISPSTLDVSYPGLSYSTYYGPLYQSFQTGLFHIGYMIGFSYEYSKRWLLDGLMEQSPVSPNVIGGYNMNAPLSAYYFRLSIGYRLQKNLHPFRNGWGKTDYGRGD